MIMNANRKHVLFLLVVLWCFFCDALQNNSPMRSLNKNNNNAVVITRQVDTVNRQLSLIDNKKEENKIPQPKTKWPSSMRSLVFAALVCSHVLFSGVTSVSAISSISSDNDNNNNHFDRRYWSIMEAGDPIERIAANKALLDHAVGSINTMYYDRTGGAYFEPREFFKACRQWLHEQSDTYLASREGAVEGLNWIVAQLRDPFSQYMTKEQLRGELSDGFLGLGAVVEPPGQNEFVKSRITSMANLPPELVVSLAQRKESQKVLSGSQVENLPTVTAVASNSPAERAGLVVGDRIVAIGGDNFLGESKPYLATRLKNKYSAENYLGHPELTVAKPIYASGSVEREVVIGYRQTRVRLPTVAVEPFFPENYGDGVIAGGDAIVQYRLVTSRDTIFDYPSSDKPVGYIRLTRFSKAATAGFFDAIEKLEKAGAASYIIDLRNNYGGVIQEAMLLASSLLRDPHAVLCYTMNSRGGFMPHAVEEFVIDSRYPGYLLSSEPKSATLNQLKRDNPTLFKNGKVDWSPPSAYASLREHYIKRGIHRPSVSYVSLPSNGDPSRQPPAQMRKDIVLLVNEGTASSAEVFAASLHDNGRTVALVGSKTYGKGLIQHTFPMPDGGGLRLTVAEFLTPNLHHVTNVGGAQFDRETGQWVGGGISPDIECDSRRGIPRNIGGDLCVGIALDALSESEAISKQQQQVAMTFKRFGSGATNNSGSQVLASGTTRDGL